MIPQLHDKEWLREQYMDKRRTLQSIADEIGCNKGSVGRALRSFDIRARKRTSKHPQLADYDWLYNAYVNEKKGLRKIGKEVGAAPGVVREHLKQKGIPMRTVREGMALAGLVERQGNRASNWQGGRRKGGNGYIYIYAPDHPKATRQGYVMEHRLVLEQKLGRYLEPYEIGHHIDGNKQNNDPANLEVKERGKHIIEHFEASHEVTRLRQENAELRQRVQELETELNWFLTSRP